MTANDFLDLLRRSQLVEEDQLTKFLGLRVDSDDLARAIVRAGVITEWQSTKLLEGKWKGFFLDSHRILGRLSKAEMGQAYLARNSAGRAVKLIIFPPGRQMPETLSKCDIKQNGSVRYVIKDYEE